MEPSPALPICLTGNGGRSSAKSTLTGFGVSLPMGPSLILVLCLVAMGDLRGPVVIIELRPPWHRKGMETIK